ncbi:MAG: hypothetical protein EAS52_18060 [Parapedobacter sp.]|nr:MAG: hypothetical protein EAS52_18060 [Parapedobacter sp.]
MPGFPVAVAEPDAALVYHVPWAYPCSPVKSYPEAGRMAGRAVAVWTGAASFALPGCRPNGGCGT